MRQGIPKYLKGEKETDACIDRTARFSGCDAIVRPTNRGNKVIGRTYRVCNHRGSIGWSISANPVTINRAARRLRNRWPINRDHDRLFEFIRRSFGV